MNICKKKCTLNNIESESCCLCNNNSEWRDKTILIAEDDKVNFFYIQSILKGININIIHARNGLEAVHLVTHNKVDLILMDVQMPVLNGLEATRLIRKTNSQIHIIAHTASENTEPCIEAGCNAYVAKPVNIKNLISCIAKLSQAKKGAGAEHYLLILKRMKEQWQSEINCKCSLKT